MQLNHQPCPHCGSSDAFSYNTVKRTYYCHSCGASPSTHGPLNKEKEIKEMEISNTYTTHRGIKPATLEIYNCQDVVSGGVVVGHRYNYPNGYKQRILPKDFSKGMPGFKSDQLFGMNKFNGGGNECLITEGELDAMSAYQMLNQRIPCVSLPSATPSRHLWSNEDVVNWLRSFNKIYVSFDSDGKSDSIVKKLVALFPNKVYEVSHTKYKDANEFLEAGAKETYVLAVRNARKVIPDFLWNTPDDFLSIIREEHADYAVPTGIEELDERIEGLIRGYLYVLQAPEGTGKTEILRMLENKLITHHPDIPIAVMHLEETRQRFLLGLASYHLKQDVTRKSKISKDLWPSVEEYIKTIGEQGNLYLFEMSESDDPNDIFDRIRYMAVGLGVQYVFFEPIQDLAINRTEGQTEEQFLSALSTRLAWLAKELNIGIITVAHENDDGQIRSCRMIGKRAGVIIKAQRDKDAPEDMKNITKLFIEKNRPLGYRGAAGSLEFDFDSFTLKEAS